MKNSALSSMFVGCSRLHVGHAALMLCSVLACSNTSTNVVDPNAETTTAGGGEAGQRGSDDDSSTDTGGSGASHSTVSGSTGGGSSSSDAGGMGSGGGGDGGSGGTDGSGGSSAGGDAGADGSSDSGGGGDTSGTGGAGGTGGNGGTSSGGTGGSGGTSGTGGTGGSGGTPPSVECSEEPLTNGFNFRCSANPAVISPGGSLSAGQYRMNRYQGEPCETYMIGSMTLFVSDSNYFMRFTYTTRQEVSDAGTKYTGTLWLQPGPKGVITATELCDPATKGTTLVGEYQQGLGELTLSFPSYQQVWEIP